MTDRLRSALQRLYFHADESKHTLSLFGPDNKVRAMLMHCLRPRDWAHVAKLSQAVQDDLDWPAPALSVAGDRGFLLWFSLAEAVSATAAESCLEALQQRYLADIPAAHVQIYPSASTPGEPPATPAQHAGSGKWSAYIDPSLGSLFSEESGLEMAPGDDRQADLLTGVRSISASEFARAREILQTPIVSPAQNNASPPASNEPEKRPRLSLTETYADPVAFLLAVMNDASASTGQRIKAAKALLPHFPRQP